MQDKKHSIKFHIIKSIHARQILDSRGNPTVEVDIMLESGHGGRAAVPSGASVGSGEALELRDNDPRLFGGKSVYKAVWNVNHKISDVLIGNDAGDQNRLDRLLCDLDGTKNKSALGANAILAVSLASAKAVARAKGIRFYKYIAELAGTEDDIRLPMPMINVLNGGAHGDWVTDFQEYMIIPAGAGDINEALRMSAEVFHTLGKVLKKHGYAIGVGDEGGYAPHIKNGNNEPLELIAEAVAQSGYSLGRDILLAMDVAASEFRQGDHYELKTNGDWKSADDLANWYQWIIDNYPVVSIEDGLAEDDWSGWQMLTERFGDRLQLVGDDLFVTNRSLLQKGIDMHVANSILIKPNQIGTLSETIETVKLAKAHGYNCVISHRSGETEDAGLAHIAIGLGTGQIKTGSVSRGERICKYNELIRQAEPAGRLRFENPFHR